MADGAAAADRVRPVAVSHRSGASYRPGIGPHTESQTVKLVMATLADAFPDRYQRYGLGVRSTDGSRQACDLCLGEPPGWDWAIEVKMLRLMGDNGKANDNILTHILSPYPAHRSALTDCDKLGWLARILMPSAVNTASKESVNWPARSLIRNLIEVARWPRFIKKLRAACVVRLPSGCAVMPARWTRRVPWMHPGPGRFRRGVRGYARSLAAGPGELPGW
jgi:hypothetical protein